jgi:glycosyltransferase involved in cell wall biosynthesis
MYLFRLVLVLLEIILINKGAYKQAGSIFFNNKSAFYSPDEYSGPAIKIMELVATLFGFRYHTWPGILPLSGNSNILRSKLKVAQQKSPLVSMIIPAHNHLSQTYNCLRSIQSQSSSTYSYEVIVVNDASTDHTDYFFNHNAEGIIYIRSEKHLGDIDARRLGLQYSRGKLVCFLSQHVQVCNNWLEHLVQTISHPDNSCAGSKVILKNGLLKHAGGIICPDGSKIDYGQYKNPDHPFYNYVREVDYCSESCLMFRKVDLEHPKTCNEDNLQTEQIIYQPLSNVIDCGYSYGPPASLSNEHTRDIDACARRHQPDKKILFIDDVVPAPDQDSGSNRLFRIMKIVKSLGYHVIFAPNDGKKRGHYFDKMTMEGFEVWYSFPNRRGMVSIIANTTSLINASWICKPHNNEFFKFIFEAENKCRWIYDTVDLHFLRLQREGELSQNTSLIESALKIKEVELSNAKQAHVTIAITDDEKKMLNNEGIKNVIVIPNIHERNKANQAISSFSNRTGILFIGGYLHSPNIDAAKWLAEQIMPKVWETDPSIKLTLLGSNPPEEVLSLASEKISVPGYIEDVSSYFNHHRIFVAPLRFGAGMKGKIGQSLEYGLPVISTQIGIEGMGLTDGRDVLIAEDTLEFAAKILHLYQSPQLWSDVRDNSAHALKAYSPDHVKQKLKELLEDLL